MKNSAIKYLKDNDFIRHNAIFFIGSLVIAGLNYLYYPVIGRFVSVSEFGEIQAILSIFTQLGILLTAFGYVVTNIINNEKDRSSSKIVILQLERVTLIIACVLLALLCLGSWLLKNGLHFTSSVPFILVGVLVLLNVPSTSRMYLLQGLRKLKEVSISGIILSVSKLILSVILILAGFNVIGVMLAYIFAQILMLIFLSRKTRNEFVGLDEGVKCVSNNQITPSQKKLVKKELIYGGAIILLLFSFTILYSFDVVVARMFLSPEDAGIYSGISVIARIVYFITASVAGVLIATVKLNDGHRNSIKALKKSSLLVLLIGGSVFVIFLLMPNLVISILMGSRYTAVSYLLPLTSFVMLISSFNNLFVCFQIARRQYRAILATLAGLIVLVVLLSQMHSDYYDIIESFLISNIVTFIVLLVQIIKKGDRYGKNAAIDSSAKL